MSRNWTPREQYLADKYMTANGHKSLRNQNFIITYNNVSKPMMSAKEMKVRAQYSELGFLFDNLYILYNKMKEHPRYRNRVLSEIDNQIKSLENNELKGVDSIVEKWFNGKLDEHFYYSERNNEVFGNYILEKYKELLK